MDDLVHPESVHGVEHRPPVTDVSLDEGDVADGGGVSELHGVERDHVAPALFEETDGVGPDVAGTAGHEHGHGPGVSPIGLGGAIRRSGLRDGAACPFQPRKPVDPRPDLDVGSQISDKLSDSSEELSRHEHLG